MTLPGFRTDQSYANELDAADPLGAVRDNFVMPTDDAGNETLYLVGNSLGVPAHRSVEYVNDELARWGSVGVRGHFESDLAWTTYQDTMAEQMADLVGASRDEVVVMNSLTVNLHLMLISFYDPTPRRHKILIEDHAFPSDHFAVESQVRQRGLDPASSMVLVSPRDGEQTLRNEDILAAITEHGDELATVLLPGVQYYTGQWLDMPAITAAGHAVGAKVGFDLAHAVGNVPVELNAWGVDFAAWCTYKYLNSGPGGVAGAFVHERHLRDGSLPKLTGWWGTNKATRFQMDNEFDAIPTAESWSLSCGPVLLFAALRGSLDVITDAGGLPAMRAKSELQIHYMDRLIDEVLAGRIRSLTPRPLAERGCQFALEVIAPGAHGRAVFEALEAANVSCDWRYPNVIRAAPVPLYNSFADIHRFVSILDTLLP
jgi:kynureninase